jgi:septum formation protein
LLRQIGVDFIQRSVDLDESVLPCEAAADYVLRLAQAKALAGWQSQTGEQKLPVLGADTSVVLNDQIMGKPQNREHGLAMLAALSGRSHQVMTAVSLCYNGETRSQLVSTEVHFRELSAAELSDYWASGEPADKAGGYGIQGFAAVFVDRIVGSYSAVVGLPLAETYQLLASWNKSSQ